ncbi:translation factor SUA5 [Rhodospirillum rubrum F11]|uniref:Threonylcarbamoyl-AMP synthase n=3 Tax=Rhodospirillum rubrum TaxID=1085 RepID=Q2RX96_RHORT|nr:L-threonylcarbamoyladenylate synthase [Rhodospirillum rubrum]ABC21249.1 translation factor SUA5 [Rhodospirillum rubrum ATCC 11170]AEO46924.1 translation factor SUA5 [Rhodospirillum rubrum F11]MBK5952802.1 threonylcarbamoyl-AMP synthase [Rhodospirillum rubrum]QXG80934.1 threonylcarbamoyl-AMP synthase [Rhodospirillum rubrum]HCF17050.1 threonylcarbamoyl-AMP synthase [Rhodospirillum rubrum]
MTSPLPPEGAALAQAARILAAGGLVAFPTETVYGLGANALDDTAVASIYAAKGRPSFNPLIVHLPDLDAARAHVAVDGRAERLAAAFWPGPLTLVLPRRAGCRLSLLVSAGLDTAAIRCPDHPLALELLRACALPLAAPSANPSGAVSPTTAAHVREGLGGRVDLVLDGGACGVGLESTVLDLSTPRALLLRPGAISRAMLAEVLGEPVDRPSATPSDPTAPRSPGQLLSHYAPTARVRLNASAIGPGEVLLGFGPVAGATLSLSPSGDLREAAANLFSMLRALDADHPATIAVSPIPETDPGDGLAAAINDRLRRAAAPRG